jgi:3-oxoacyl-(acyl-carrier-protein) synthase
VEKSPPLRGFAAALDVAALLAMCDGVVPPMINLDRPADGCELAFVTEAKPMRLDTVLISARGCGGFNSALVLGRIRD